MTRSFLDAYPEGVFKGWKCTVDYSLGRPLNPDALIGQRVGKTFDGVEHFGVIKSFKKWWKVVFDDGDREVTSVTPYSLPVSRE